MTVLTERRRLSTRERQVLELVAGGRSNEEIAAELGIRPETVRSHVRRLLAALGARNRAHAVGRGFELGYLSAAGNGGKGYDG